MIDPSIIEDILKHADIVDVVSTFINVIKKGRNFVAVCPFHDDKNPSMMLSRDKQIFKCFVCGTGGNVITFVQHYEKVSYIQAVKKVAEIIGYNDERLNSFKEGFTFIKAGGTESVYSDRPCRKWYRKGKHKAEITSNVSILPSTYTLGISGEYDRILRYEKDFLDTETFI